MNEDAFKGEQLVASALLGCRADNIQRVQGRGRNSRVFLVHSAGSKYALKQYPFDNNRNRLETETGALALMEQGGIKVVPKLIASNAELGYVMMSWVEGRAVEPVTGDDLDSAARFLRAVHGLRALPDAVAQPSAAEACLSGEEILRQIANRLERLRRVAPGSEDLDAFLTLEMEPVLRGVTIWSREGYDQAQMSFSDILPPARRTLCPSDFGFHNALRTPDGQLIFIDFEYFGWDDPVKLVSDFLLHPSVKVSTTLKHAFARAALETYGEDPTFITRLNLLYPLFGLRWCVILLNEFLPERWAVRIHAGERSDWTTVRTRQIVLARTLLKDTMRTYQACPYLASTHAN